MWSIVRLYILSPQVKSEFEHRIQKMVIAKNAREAKELVICKNKTPWYVMKSWPTNKAKVLV